MVSKLLKAYYNGEKRALARMITLVDNRGERGIQLMNELYPKKGRAQVIGFTGPPGSGKSTLVTSLVKRFRENDKTVAIIAVDPTSPYSKGAILGDRIRMLDFTQDSGVFIRSMASRGRLGGLSTSTFDCVKILDIFGFDIIVIETVGAGQSEVDIVKTCDTTVVLAVPGLGDEIQILKAGIMEIADIFVVNKSDKVGADVLSNQIENMIQMDTGQKWVVPVCLTTAIEDRGITELLDKIESHWSYLKSNNIDKLRQERFKEEFLLRINEFTTEKLKSGKELDKIINEILNGNISTSDAIKKILS